MFMEDFTLICPSCGKEGIQEMTDFVSFQTRYTCPHCGARYYEKSDLNIVETKRVSLGQEKADELRDLIHDFTMYANNATDLIFYEKLKAALELVAEYMERKN